jgi:hypothetical protein
MFMHGLGIIIYIIAIIYSYENYFYYNYYLTLLQYSCVYINWNSYLHFISYCSWLIKSATIVFLLIFAAPLKGQYFFMKWESLV